MTFDCVYFLQPPSGQSGHCCARQLLSVLAHQQAQRQQQRRIQRQLRLETGRWHVFTGDIYLHSPDTLKWHQIIFVDSTPDVSLQQPKIQKLRKRAVE